MSLTSPFLIGRQVVHGLAGGDALAGVVAARQVDDHDKFSPGMPARLLPGKDTFDFVDDGGVRIHFDQFRRPGSTT